jgi:small subunit ribosomal protein S2
MALVDTNCDPDPSDYVIACNDDALKSIKIVLSTLMQAIVDKKNEMNLPVAKGDGEESSDVGEEESETE